MKWEKRRGFQARQKKGRRPSLTKATQAVKLRSQAAACTPQTLKDAEPFGLVYGEPLAHGASSPLHLFTSSPLHLFKNRAVRVGIRVSVDEQSSTKGGKRNQQNPKTPSQELRTNEPTNQRTNEPRTWSARKPMHTATAHSGHPPPLWQLGHTYQYRNQNIIYHNHDQGVPALADRRRMPSSPWHIAQW